MKNNLILFVTIILFAFSCNKDKDAPTLVINSPSDGATVTGTVTIAGMVTDKSLHEMTVLLTKDADGSELFSKTITDVHDLASYNFNETYNPVGINSFIDVTCTVTVEDHMENKTTKTVKFKLKS
jgi:hypothetical protein